MDGSVKRIGLVLSGGGAKGAYQLGIFRALRELGLSERVCAVSGASIGALNALLFSTGRPMIWNGVWRRLSSLLASSGGSGELHSTHGLISALSLFTRLPGVLGKRPLYACAYDIAAAAPAYFEMSALPPREAATVCTASCALPDVFLPVEYRGRRYCDGGMPPVGSALDNGDKIPTLPLRAAGCDTIVISYLKPGDQADLSGFPAGTRFVELRPSRSLEAAPHSGTLDFGADILAQNRELGYTDNIEKLRELI